MARPAPARPPDHAGNLRSVTDNEARIRELSERIAMLERSLEQQKNNSDLTDTAHFRPPSSVGSTSGHSPVFANNPSPGLRRCPSLHGDSSPYSSPEPCGSQDDTEEQPAIVLSQGTFELAGKLMQLTAGLRGEYLGNRGSWDLLRMIMTDGSTTPKNLQSSLTDISSAVDGSEVPVFPPPASIEQLVERIPPAAVLSAILSSYFTEINWNFGLPEHWLYTAIMRMWNTLHYPDVQGSRVNACWLSLLFSIIACTPRVDPQLKNAGLESPSQYFSYAKAALFIAEESFHERSRAPSTANGGVFGCLAVPLLCTYQAKEGRLAESWKLLGKWIRIAQSFEIHLDPDRRGWHGISEEEKCLWKLAWCNLTTWDKFYSMVLGRPQMVGIDVPAFISSMLSHPDGASNFFSIYQSALIKLANITGEVNVRCIGAEKPFFKTVCELDESLQQWKAQLPYEYRIRTGEHLDSNTPSLASTLNFRQWYTLSIWYLYGRMKLHLGYLTGDKEPSYSSPNYPPYLSRRQSRAQCLAACLDILRLQCETFELLGRYRAESAADDDSSVAAYFSWDFIGLVALFEAVVGLVSLMTRQPVHGSLHDMESVIGRSIQLFTSLSHSTEGTCGELAHATTTLLDALLREISGGRTSGTASNTLSRTPSPPQPPSGSAHRLPNDPGSLLVLDPDHEGWMTGTSNLKYDWYPSLNTITTPTVDMYAHSHSRDNYHDSTDPYRFGRS
ncbi:hypothetical protein V5O48_004246 [Marasmius crinis-equi]|uniref:Xylanolytic transcriptional activator regulatory domain-containing protein n=1 Tax=Marasmius crinis-equi TaxID=585013 RepID=A0ABR3FQR4_9AGAR